MTLPLPEKPRRLVYIGTPDLAVPTLDALHSAGFDIALVITRPDVRRGRRGEPSPSPVKAAAQRLGIPVSHDVDDALGVDADLGVVVAYGKLIKSSVLESLPMVNLHFSLLPRWRGAAPVERAILAGDESTGVCIMDVVDELDAGDVFAHTEIPISNDATLQSLRAELVEIGTELLIDGLHNGFGSPVAQRGASTYAHKLGKDDLHLDWADSAINLHRRIRVGGAWSTFRGKRFKVWEAAVLDPLDIVGEPGDIIGRSAEAVPSPTVITGDGGLVLTVVQPEGKPRMDAQSWANGAHLTPQDRFTT